MRLSDDLHDAFDSDEPDPALEAELDEEFPLGDGDADMSAEVVCPYCAEHTEIAVDPGSGASQDYVEDCGVCCRPWRVTVSYSGGVAQVHLAPLDD